MIAWTPSSSFVNPAGSVAVVGNQSFASVPSSDQTILAEIVTLAGQPVIYPVVLQGEVPAPERVFIREYILPFIVELTFQVLTPPDYSILLTGAKGGLYTDMRRYKILQEDDELLKLGVL